MLPTMKNSFLWQLLQPTSEPVVGVSCFKKEMPNIFSLKFMNFEYSCLFTTIFPRVRAQRFLRNFWGVTLINSRSGREEVHLNRHAACHDGFWSRHQLLALSRTLTTTPQLGHPSNPPKSRFRWSTYRETDESLYWQPIFGSSNLDIL